MSRRALLLSPLVFLIAFTAIKVTDFAQGRGVYTNAMQVAAPGPNVLGGAISAMGKLRSRNFATQSSLASPAGASLDASAIFLEAPEYGTGGNNAISLAVADLNGDGKLDLVVANGCVLNSQCGSQTAGIVGVLLGNGDGTFQSAVTYFSGSSKVYSVTVADVNGDGKPDLLVGGACPNGDCMAGATVSLLLGNGDGTFQPGVSYSAPSGSGTVVVADVNGDGKPDVVLAGGAVGVLLGNGNGTFQPEVSYSGGGNAADSVAVADVNGDGKLDLIVANQTMGNGTPNGGVGVLLGNGNGTFQPALTYYSGGQNAHSIAVADVNGDGKADLVIANGYIGGDTFTGGTGVLLGNGDGTFQSAVAYPSGGYQSEFAVVADVNSDGKPDLVVSNQCQVDGSTANCVSGVVSVQLGNGDGTFQPAVRYTSGGGYGYAIATGDVNGDGKLDLLLANQCGNPGCTIASIGVLLGNGDGSFQSALMFSSGVYPDTSVAAADVNGDGKPDLVVANLCITRTNCASGGVGVLLGKGDGTFQAPMTYGSGGFNANSVAVGDVNGDGKPDIIVAKQCVGGTCATGTVGVLLGNGDGTFQPVVNYGSGGQNAYSVAIMDVNGDGKPDVLVANECVSASNCTNGVAGVLLGNGDGTFMAAVSYGSGGQYPVSISVADINGDGKPDLLVGNYYTGNGNSTGSLGVLLGKGDGTFQAAVSYSSGGIGDNSIAVGDVNGDGKPDLLAGNQCGSTCTNGTLGVLLGNGDGTFQPAIVSATPVINVDFFEALALADFNGDGKLDVACGAGNFVLLGNGDGSFQPSRFLGAGGIGIAVGDFNLDGNPDLAVGGITILLNSTAPKTATTTTLVSSPQSSTYGQNVAFTATVMPKGTGSPTGVVTFTDGAITLGTVSVTNGTAKLSTSAVLTGTRSITASYSGDSNFVASASLPLTQYVNRATTATKLISSANPAYLNQTITFNAIVGSQYGGSLTGNVTFKQGTTTLATMALANGQAAYSRTYTTTGTRYISAVYSGDGNNQSSLSAVLNQVVNSLPAATATKVTSSGSPSLINQPVTFTVTITSTYGPIPDGETVTFYDGTAPIGTGATTSGVAAFSTSTLTAKTHTIKVTYPGDATFKASSGTVIQVVNLYPSTISVPTSSLNPSTYGQSVTLRATVISTAPSTPTGTVNFKNGTTSLGTATLNASGVATLAKGNIPAGTDSINATYNGDSETAKSASATLLQTVNQASTTTTVKSSLNPSLLGQSVTFTATVISPTTTPAGSVTFLNGTNALGTVTLSGNKASYSTSTLTTGSHNIAAVYNGTGNIGGSTSSALVQTVN